MGANPFGNRRKRHECSQGVTNKDVIRCIRVLFRQLEFRCIGNPWTKTILEPSKEVERGLTMFGIHMFDIRRRSAPLFGLSGFEIRMAKGQLVRWSHLKCQHFLISL